MKVRIVKNKNFDNVLEAYKFPTPVLTTLTAFKECISNEVQQLKNDHYDLYWHDGEDYLMIASENCLKMFWEIQPDVVYVNIAGSKIASSFYHPHIECDNCQMSPIQGPRFKCLQCPNFDLCVQCEGLGVHGDHSMIRLTKPMRMPVSSILKKRFLWQLVNDSKQSSSSSEEEEGQCPFLFDKSRKHHHRKDGGFCSKGKGHHEGKGRQEGKGHHHEGKGHYVHGEHRHERKRHCHAEWPNIVKHYLDAFGEVATKTMDTAVNASRSEVFQNAFSAPQESVSNPKVNTETRENNGESNSSDQSQNVAGSSQAPPNNLNQSQNATEVTQPDAGVRPKTNIPEGIQNPSQLLQAVLNAAPTFASSLQQITQSLAQQRVADPDDIGWTVINSSDREQSPAASATVPPTNLPSTSQANTSAVASAPLPDERIKQGLEILTSMGFTNENDILTQILQMSEGDVTKSLDILAVFGKK